MAAPLRALFLVPYPLDRAPGQRYRFEQWLDLLPDGAIAAEVRPLFDATTYDVLYQPGSTPRKVLAAVNGLGRRLRDVTTARRYDVVVVYRELFPLGPGLLERFLESRTPVVYDFDDAIYLGDTSTANRAVSRLKVPSKVEGIVRRAAATTVSTERLATWARAHSSNVHVLPSTVDTERYRPAPVSDRDVVRIGWSGSATTAAHLRSIDGALRRVLESTPTELVVVGAPEYRLPGARDVDVRRWSPATELDDLASFDIGIMPLPDDEWSRGKAGMKALLYMAVGAATVVSPVGANTDIVTDGHNGRLATTEDEWVDVLTELVHDAGERARLGAAGRATVEERFSGQRWAPVFLDVLSQAAATD
jgi:glycosyltransferase involved in cell wall biosynthesis